MIVAHTLIAGPQIGDPGNIQIAKAQVMVSMIDAVNSAADAQQLAGEGAIDYIHENDGAEDIFTVPSLDDMDRFLGIDIELQHQGFACRNLERATRIQIDLA